MKMIWMLLLAFSAAQATTVRICVPESLAASCAQMSEDLPETFTCVIAPDIFGCVEKVTSGEADVVNVDPNGLYLAGKFFNLRPIVTELVDGEPYRYQGIALVSKESTIQSAADLRGKKSCHTGFWRTVGWQIPVGQLLSKNVMEPSCDEGELAAVKNFFGGSCVPGNWSKDPVVDQKLKEKYSGLCSQCKDPSTCTAEDTYAGYEGVIRCLKDGAADVAFTKIPVLKEYLEKDPSFADRADLLCFDGGRKGLRDAEPCVWGTRPTNVFVSRADDKEEETERLVTALLNTQTRYSVPQVRIPDWYYKSFLANPKVSGIRRTEESRRTYIGYLGDFIHTIRKPRPGCEVGQHDVSLCVTSDEEQFKCQDYAKAAEARGLWPNVQCVKGASKAACMETLKEGNAHILVLDGGDVYKAGRYYSLQPIAGELYNGSDATYYAVALLRSPSDVDKLSDLRGLRSCHTGMGRTAGWIMPVGVLLTEGLLSSDDACNRAAAVADFFSAGSCVPGANDTKYNPGRVRNEDLCKRCIGDEDGLNRCARDSQERYNGYAGALRCLAEGAGDVAFVKHATALEYTDGKSDLPWAKDLVSTDFELLCDGGGTKPVADYLQCNLGKVPSHQVVAKGDVSEQRRLQLSGILADTSRYFSGKFGLYRLFFKRQQPDLLFKDSATGLKVTPLNSNYQEVLGSRFLEASKAADPKDCV